MAITEHQAEYLALPTHDRLSPGLQKCCLLISANVSYQNAEQDIQTLTGVFVSRSTQQRLVHRQELAPMKVSEAVQELSIDGGNIRLRSAVGEESTWRNYKAVAIHGQATGAYFQENDKLVEWVNSQHLANPITCVGDGHDGIWNLVEKISLPGHRREILDWFHLIENLHKIPENTKRLLELKALLWQGKSETVIQRLQQWKSLGAQNFCSYLSKHKARIVDYGALQKGKVCSIGSGAVESAVKQINRRVQISGARWKKENVPKVLAHRCAYLNGQLYA